MAEWSPPPFRIETETFVATLAQVAATQGDAAAVAILAESEPAISYSDCHTDYGQEWHTYTLRLELDAGLYGRLSGVREEVCKRMSDLARDISSAHDEYAVVQSVVLAPVMRAAEGWRANAKGWLRGEGINNQGRVRSDNIAARQHDGLLFRSEPEIHLYNALKAKGVHFAPLPVFVRGGSSYQRLEPDFVLVHKGVVMVVEIDGATVHRESPAEAHARTQGLQRDGVRVERVPASECVTRQDADRCATKLIEALDRYRELRG